MITSQSPEHVLRAQAGKMADALKRTARGEKIADDPAGRLAASIASGVVKFAVVMDDKVITVEMPWKTIRNMATPLLADLILDEMKGARRAAH